MTRISRLLAFALLCPTAAFAQQPDSRVARVDSIFADMQGTARPGCAVGALKDGQFLLRKGYGMANLESGLAITPETVFYMGSLSKQFTAMSIALLAQDNRLRLDDPARTMLPEIPAMGAGITVRHMIHHQSGLREKWELLALMGRRDGDLVTQQDVFDLVQRQQALSFAPGTDFLYNNTAYDLLGSLVQRVSGQSLRHFAAARIFTPLGMGSSQFVDSRGIIVPRRAQGYSASAESVRLNLPNVENFGSGSLYSTIDDMARWDESFYTGALGGQALLTTVQTPLQLLNGGPNQTYAFGMIVDQWRGLRRVHHSGALAGFRTALVRFPDQHFSAVVLCNFAEAQPTAYATRMAEVYLADHLRPEPARELPTVTPAQPITLTPTQRTGYAGRYTSLELGVTWTVSASDSGLVATPPTGAAIHLQPVAADSFRITGGGIGVVRGRGNRIEALRLSLARSRNILFTREK